MSGKTTRWFVVLTVLVLLAGGAWWGWSAVQARREWAAFRPPTPDLKAWPAEFRSRIENADAKIASWPPDAHALGELAQLYLANGFLKEAETALRGAIRYEPNNPRWTHHLARLLAGYGELEAAVPLWRTTAELAPDYLPARVKLADALLKTNQPDEAARTFAAVLERDPKNPYALLGLARLDVDSGRWSAARQRLEAATVAAPEFSAAHSQLATVAERLGDTATAQLERDQATALGRFKDVPDPWTEELVAYCYDVYRLQVIAATITATKGGAAALPPLERALALAPQDARTVRQLGRVYLDLKDYAKARQMLEKAIQLDGTDPSPYLDLVEVFRAERNVDAAITMLTAGIQKCSESAGLHHELGLALLGAERLEEAVPHFQEARRREPGNMAAYEDLSRTLLRLGRPAEAEEVLRSALDQNDRAGPLLLLMARCQIALRNEPRAEEFIRRTREARASETTLSELRQEFRAQFGRVPR
ncbi:hypothetical protein DB347_14590 [Opitutaceae bacterium EW11]|nr:hypothetical protein DB347_14590 [Opitutaceae bacterium EW11]